MEAYTQHDEGASVTEQLARSSLEAFKAVAENTPDLILRFDRQYRHVYVNPAAERRMRRRRHNILGKTQRELGLAAEVARQWEEHLERVFRSGRERQFEFALGASWVDAHEHFEARAVPEAGRHGEVASVLMVVRDVTERRRAEVALAQREAALANAQRIAGCGSFQLELATGELHGSAELQRLVPFPPGASARAQLADLLAIVHEADRARVQRTLEGAAQGAGSWSLQFRAVDRDGLERILHSRGEVEVDEQGQPVRLHGTALDVTEQEDVQDAVRQLLCFTQFAVDHVEDAILFVDPTGCVVAVNRAACKRFGQPVEALAGKPVAMLGLKMNPEEAWPACWLQIKDAGRVRYEVARADGVSLEVVAQHAELKGQEYACLFVRDARPLRPAAPAGPELGPDFRKAIETIVLLTELLGRTDEPGARARAVRRIAEIAKAQLGQGELEIRGVGRLRAFPVGATGG